MSAVNRKGSLRLKFAWFVFILALCLPLWFIAAALGSKFGLWAWPFGLGKMTFDWGPKLIIGVAALAGLALLLGVLKAPRIKPVILSVLTLFITGLAFGRIAGTGSQAASLPPIHDVQTDWSDPIQFSDKVMELRGPTSNPVENDPVIPEAANGRWPGIGGKSVAGEQAKAYPEIKSKIINVPKDVVYSAAYSTLSEMGMEIITEDEAGGVIEATYTSQWFGFKDDVAVRISEQGEGSQIDVRSVSRVGLSDLGANAARIRDILAGIETRLRTAK